MIPPYEKAIIKACTGPGGVSWQNVAKQLGISLHDARKFDPNYQWDRPPAKPSVVDVADEEAPRKRGRPKSDAPSPFRALALRALLDGPLDTAQLAVATDTARDRVSSRMTTLIGLGLAVRYRQWGPKAAPLYRLSGAGRSRALTSEVAG